MVTDGFIEQIQQKKAAQDGSSILSAYETPLVTVDIVLFTVINNTLQVLLIQRKTEPYQEMWAIPGGFIHVGETLEEAAARRLKEETSAENIFLAQLHAFGGPKRDPRARVITVAYYALVSAERLNLETQSPNNSSVGDIQWFSVSDLPELAFDHKEILKAALHRLKKQLQSTSVAFQLLPAKFTLTELQRVYELILGKSLDKRNFRKKILSSDILQDTGETKMEGYHRPAQLYQFVQREKAALVSG